MKAERSPTPRTRDSNPSSRGEDALLRVAVTDAPTAHATAPIHGQHASRDPTAQPPWRGREGDRRLIHQHGSPAPPPGGPQTG